MMFCGGVIVGIVGTCCTLLFLASMIRSHEQQELRMLRARDLHPDDQDDQNDGGLRETCDEIIKRRPDLQ